MKPYKTTYTDRDGKKVRKGFRNGIKETLLVEPSDWYKEHKLKPAKQQSIEEEKEIQKKIRIQNKLREMAEEELEKEKP